MSHYNIDAEQAVIAGCLLDNSQVDKVSLSLDDFYDPHHQAIWAAIHDIMRRDGVADVVSVDDYLGVKGPGLARLAEMVRGASNAGTAERHAPILKDKSRRRAISLAVGSVLDDLNNPGADVLSIIDSAQERLSSLIGHSDRKVGEVKDWVGDWLDLLDRRVQGEESEMGISTGIAELDEYFTLKSPDLHVLAGESGMGKTVAACHLMDHVTMRQGKPSIMFQLEMSKEAVWERVAASFSGARTSFMKRPGQVSGDDWPQLGAAFQRVQEASMVIDDRPGLTMAQIRGECKRWRDYWGEIGVIIIDYVGIVEPDDKRAPREQQIAQIAKAAKQLAKDIDCHVVLMAQINRDNTRRTDKRPIVTDLRESAALQHNADIISLVYREEYHNPESDRRGILEWIVGKNREGACGTVEMVCDLARSRLTPLTGEELSRWHQEHPAPNKQSKPDDGFSI